MNHLAITALERLTDDAVMIEFAVPDALRAEYRFRPGQHVTVVFDNDGTEARRSYSLCGEPYTTTAAGAAPANADGNADATAEVTAGIVADDVDEAPRDEARLRIAVKELGPGGFGHLAATKLAVGDSVKVLPPAGRFHLQPGDEHVAIAAGSGITPVMAMMTAALRRGDRFSLIYGNRTTNSVMFLEELSDLKNRYPETFTVLHVLSREPREAPLLSGRIEAERLPRLLEALAPSPEAQYYLCGPMALVDTAKAVLKDMGIERTHVHFELFHADDAPPPENYAATEKVLEDGDVAVTVHLTGRTTRLTMNKSDNSVLDAVLKARADTPYSCTGGVCGTCRAKVLDGEVVMARDYALEPEEKAEGFVLACQSRPLTASVELDFDA